MSAVWPAVYSLITASVTQVVSPELRTISRRTSWRSFYSSSANFTANPPSLNAFFMPGWRRSRRGPVDGQQPRTSSGPADGQAEGNRGPARLGDEKRAGDAEAVERRTDPEGLGGEGVVGLLGVGGPAVAQRLDHDAAVSTSNERLDDRAIAERGAEEPRDEDDRRAGTDGGGAERLAGGDLDVAHPRAIGGADQECQH